jgi:hypothetical protein
MKTCQELGREHPEASVLHREPVHSSQTTWHLSTIIVLAQIGRKRVDRDPECPTPPFSSRFLVRREVMKDLHTVTVVAIFLLGLGVGALLVWIRLAGAKRRFATELEKALFGRLRKPREISGYLEETIGDSHQTTVRSSSQTVAHGNSRGERAQESFRST